MVEKVCVLAVHRQAFLPPRVNYTNTKETTMEETNYKALFDRMEILIDKSHNTKKYSKKRRKKYKKLMHKQLKFLRAQLE